LLSSFSAAQEYHFVSIEKLIEQEVGRIIIPEIYKKLGIKVTISPLPGKRAQSEAVSGELDGEIMRVWSYGEENPTTIRVPTPYYHLETMPFVKKGSEIKISNKEDLKRYGLVKVLGVKHTNNITMGMPKVQSIGNTERMMKFLNAGRADIALTNTINGRLVLEKLGIRDIVAMENPLEVLHLYHYIHVKHKEIIPKVDAVIKQMKDSGELRILIKKAEQKVIKNNLD